MKKRTNFVLLAFLVLLTLFCRCVMALIRGLQALYPCPICYVKKEEQADHSIVGKLWTAAESQDTMREGRAKKTTEEREDVFKNQSLRNIEVPWFFFQFITKPHSSGYRTRFGTSPTRIPIKHYLLTGCMHTHQVCGVVICFPWSSFMLRPKRGASPPKLTRGKLLFSTLKHCFDGYLASATFLAGVDFVISTLWLTLLSMMVPSMRTLQRWWYLLHIPF
jgi:hypothetical protein